MILATFKDSTTAASRPNIKSGQREQSLSPDSSVTEFSSEGEVEEVDPERDEKLLGWLYIGSHNFTPSAWGTLSGSSFNPVMNVRPFHRGFKLY